MTVIKVGNRYFIQTDCASAVLSTEHFCSNLNVIASSSKPFYSGLTSYLKALSSFTILRTRMTGKLIETDDAHSSNRHDTSSLSLAPRARLSLTLYRGNSTGCTTEPAGVTTSLLSEDLTATLTRVGHSFDLAWLTIPGSGASHVGSGAHHAGTSCVPRTTHIRRAARATAGQPGPGTPAGRSAQPATAGWS
jgi:hypothetical protein